MLYFSPYYKGAWEEDAKKTGGEGKNKELSVHLGEKEKKREENSK